MLSSFCFLSTFFSSNSIRVLGLSETLLSDKSSSSVGISGYKLVTRNRATRSKRGLALFINQDLHVLEMTELSDLYQEMGLEYLIVEIMHGKESYYYGYFIGLRHQTPRVLKGS